MRLFALIVGSILLLIGYSHATTPATRVVHYDASTIVSAEKFVTKRDSHLTKKEPFLMSYINESDSDTVDAFITDMQDELSNYNIELIEDEAWEQFPPNHIGVILFGEHRLDENNTIQVVYVEAWSHGIATLSPILQFSSVIGMDMHDDSTENFFLGMVLYAGNYFRQAEAYLTTVQQDDLMSGSISFYLGNLALAREDYESAIQLFQQIERIPKSNLAWAYLQNGQEDEAFSFITNEINNAIENNVHPSISYFLEVRAILYTLIFDYDNAIADIDEAIAVAEENNFHNSSLARLYTIRGEIIFLIYEWDRVEDNFNMAIELNPEYDRAYFQRGVLYYTMARREDALADFQTYLDIQPNGIYADEAQSYIESIEIELEALSG